MIIDEVGIMIGKLVIHHTLCVKGWCELELM
jgi:hypothetical protein